MMGDTMRDTVVRVNRLEEQIKLLRTLFINTKTNEMTWMRRALDRATRRRVVEEEWLEEDRVHEDGQQRLLEAQELLLESLLKDSVWTEVQPTKAKVLPKILVDSHSDTEFDFKTESQQVTQKTPDEDVEFITTLPNKKATAPPAKPQSSTMSIADTIKSLQNKSTEELQPQSIEREHERKIAHHPQPQACSSSSSTGWIKPKAPKPNVKAKYFSAAPQNSNTKTSPPPWVLSVTRTDKNQREAQKRLKQTTLLEMSHRSRGQSSVDLSTLSGYGGGERKVIKFGRSASPPCAPAPPLEVPHPGQKRKSLEVDDDDAFGIDDDSLLQDFPMTAIVKDNKENEQMEESNANESVTNWDDETLFGNADFQAYLEQGVESLPKSSPSAPPDPSPSPQKRPGVLCLRNKKKDQMIEANLNRSRNDLFRSTQEIVRDFDKIPTVDVQPRFKFKPDRAIRKKAERRQLNGYDCPECKAYWEGVESQLGSDELRKLKDKCSRHRGMHQEAEYEGNTPPFFWREDFPSTEECPHVDGVPSPSRNRNN